MTPEDVEQTWEQMVSLERDAAGHVKEAAAPVIAKVAGKLRRSADSAASAPEAVSLPIPALDVTPDAMNKNQPLSV